MTQLETFQSSTEPLRTHESNNGELHALYKTGNFFAWHKFKGSNTTQSGVISSPVFETKKQAEQFINFNQLRTPFERASEGDTSTPVFVSSASPQTGHTFKAKEIEKLGVPRENVTAVIMCVIRSLTNSRFFKRRGIRIERYLPREEDSISSPLHNRSDIQLEIFSQPYNA